MRHDTLVPDGPFEGGAPGRALTQVYQQTRAEFLLVYKDTTKIHVPLEDLKEFIDTWLQAPISGTVIVDTNRHNKERRDAGSMNGTNGNISVDMVPLDKLRRENKNFRFHVNFGSHVHDLRFSYPLHIDRDLVELKLHIGDWDHRCITYQAARVR